VPAVPRARPTRRVLTCANPPQAHWYSLLLRKPIIDGSTVLLLLLMQQLPC
jgi:hypothetical protein